MAVNIEQLHDIFLKTSGVCTDSRNVFADCMFFALKGANSNGNIYAAEALQRGALYAVVDEDVELPADKVIRVENVLKTLQELATFHRQCLGIPIFAITGTNGKTTTKELLAAVLSNRFNVTATSGNLNNHIGVPLTLLSMTKETELGVVEMGANHPHEIAELCEIAQPTAGLITNVGMAHLEGFGSFEKIKETKAELYEYLAKNKGQVFAWSESPDLQEMLQKNNVQNTLYYGFKELGASIAKLDGNPYLTLNINGDLWYTQLVGDYNASNVLAAIAVGKCYGVAVGLICTAIEEYTPQNNRSQQIETKHNTVIMDAYNANPSSMGAAISSFANNQQPNKMLILGDMLELGSDSQAEHQKVLDLLQQQRFQKVYLVGKNFCEAAKNSLYLSFDTVASLCSYLQKEQLLGYAILVKGSRGIQLEKVLDYL